jgi:hypothetical protein
MLNPEYRPEGVAMEKSDVLAFRVRYSIFVIHYSLIESYPWIQQSVSYIRQNIDHHQYQRYEKQ